MENADKNYAKIELREDGIYLIVNNKFPDNKVTRTEILSIVESHGIQALNFGAIGECVNAKSGIIERKISDSTTLPHRKEEIVVTVDKNRMTARVTFRKPLNSDEMLTPDEIRTAINNKGVRFGILEDTLSEIIENRNWDEKGYIIAKGKEAFHGADGYIKYHFNTEAKNNKPKELETGKVDFRDLDLVEMAVQDEILLSSIAPIEGENGINVLGEVINYKKPKNPPAFPRGQNTYISEDGTKLLAAISGQIIYNKSRLDISPVLEIQGNVDNSTGNIDFVGSVVVKGNVLNDFVITARGNIEVLGVVEGARLISDANIFLLKGVQGQDKAFISAGGNIVAKFVESGELSAKGNITADSIMHSNVTCGETLELTGKNGLLVGGKITVKEKIIANVIGSYMATVTDIEVGHNPDIINKYRDTKAEYENLLAEMEKIKNVINLLEKANANNMLNDEKKDMLERSKRTKDAMQEKTSNMHTELEAMASELTSEKGEISVSKVVRPGVKVLIGNAVMYIRDDLYHCVLKNNGGRIGIDPL